MEPLALPPVLPQRTRQITVFLTPEAHARIKDRAEQRKEPVGRVASLILEAASVLLLADGEGKGE